jgi:Predicted sulfurtransferase
MITVLSFYKLQKINKLKSLKNFLFNEINALSIKGLVILSPEGINGTLAGSANNINSIKKIIVKNLRISKFDIQNITKSKFIPFLKAKIKIKAEVVPINEKYNFDKKFKKKYLTPLQ